VFEPFRSFHRPYHPAPLYSIERENDLVPIEHSLQTFHRSLRVPAVFPQDAPGVLNGADERILVWIVHNGTQLYEIRIKIGEEFSFPFGAAVLCLGGYHDWSAFCLQPSDSFGPNDVPSDLD
jgi:hypothetical protein